MQLHAVRVASVHLHRAGAGAARCLSIGSRDLGTGPSIEDWNLTQAQRRKSRTVWEPAAVQRGHVKFQLAQDMDPLTAADMEAGLFEKLKAAMSPPELPPSEGTSEASVADANRITLIGAGVNALAGAGKGAAGLYAGSPALIADAGHSLSDLMTDAVALWFTQRESTPHSPGLRPRLLIRRLTLRIPLQGGEQGRRACERGASVWRGQV